MDRAPVSNSAAKHWCFTLNDVAEVITSDQVLAYLGPHADYLVFQQERGESGTLHYQGYVELKKPMRLNQLTNLSPIYKPHWEKRRGKRAEARAYAMKEDTRTAGPWEGGDKPWSDKQGNAGHRSDLDGIAAMVADKATDFEIFTEYPGQTLRYLNNIQKLRQVFPPTRDGEFKVILCWGPPDTGKTRSFWDTFPIPTGFSVPVGKNLWFNGYQGQKAVLIDDFAGGIGLTQILQILDRYPIQVETKGSHTWFAPEFICVTSNVHPCNWYNFAMRTSSYQALKRRFHHVLHFKNLEDQPEELDLDIFFDAMKEPGRFWPLWENGPTAPPAVNHVTGQEPWPDVDDNNE